MSDQIQSCLKSNCKGTGLLKHMFADNATITLARGFRGLVMGKCVIGMSGHFGPGYQQIQWWEALYGNP